MRVPKYPGDRVLGGEGGRGRPRQDTDIKIVMCTNKRRVSDETRRKANVDGCVSKKRKNIPRRPRSFVSPVKYQ